MNFQETDHECTGSTESPDADFYYWENLVSTYEKKNKAIVDERKNGSPLKRFPPLQAGEKFSSCFPFLNSWFEGNAASPYFHSLSFHSTFH